MHQTKKGFLIGAVIGLVWPLTNMFIVLPLVEKYPIKAPGGFLKLLFIIFSGPTLIFCGPESCSGSDFRVWGIVIIVLLHVVILGFIGAIVGRFINKKSPLASER